MLIIALFIIAAGMGAYFIFQKPTPQPQIGKCGDGVCDEFERANPNLCLKDCTITAVTTPFASVKSALMYQTIIDHFKKRTPTEIADILAGLKTDLVFAAFAESEPISQSQYAELKDAIHKIKTKLPDAIIFGGAQPEFLPKDDPDTGLPIAGGELEKWLLYQRAYQRT